MENFWSRYKRNHAAVFGLFVVVLIIVMAITASFLYPEDPFRLVQATVKTTNQWLSAWQ
jgi:ABC-type antimicrobial peptide transport system permease subunit